MGWANSRWEIVHHDAIDSVYDLALGFWHKAKESGLIVDVSAALGYAMQILCAHPEGHLLEDRPDVWASDDEGVFREVLPDGSPWSWRHPLSAGATEVRPAIIHLPHTRALFMQRRQWSR